MEKLFSFNKFFLFFCAVFVFEWLALQIVGYLRLTNLAKIDGEKILAWQWRDKNLRSAIQIYDTKIFKRESNDAIVKVLGWQSIKPITTTGTEQSAMEQPNINDQDKFKCSATLTYYRTNSQWYLGKVECE